MREVNDFLDFFAKTAECGEFLVRGSKKHFRSNP
jgi:hypothetical protein